MLYALQAIVVLIVMAALYVACTDSHRGEGE